MVKKRRSLHKLILLSQRIDEFAGIVRQSFKFQVLKLKQKRRVLHFRYLDDFTIWLKLINYAIEGLLVSLGNGCFKLVTDMVFIFKFNHFGAHPS